MNSFVDKRSIRLIVSEFSSEKLNPDFAAGQGMDLFFLRHSLMPLSCFSYREGCFSAAAGERFWEGETVSGSCYIVRYSVSHIWPAIAI